MTDETISNVTPEKAPKNEGAKKPKQGSAKSRAREHGRILNGETPPQYKVHGTEVKINMRVGNNDLARVVKRNWNSLHHSLHYITDFSVRHMGGKVVSTANRGVSEYISSRIEEATQAMKIGMTTAEGNFIKLGEAGSLNEFELKVACDKERDVMELIKLLDDYVVVADSLWIGKFMDKKKRDQIHHEVCATIDTLNRLLSKIRTKMIDYRRRKTSNTLTKDDQGYMQEIENLVLDVTGIDLKTMRETEAAERGAAKKASAALKQGTTTSANDSVLPEPTEQELRMVAAA